MIKIIRFLCIGTGGSTKVIIDIIKENKKNKIIGMLDDDESLFENYFNWSLIKCLLLLISTWTNRIPTWLKSKALFFFKVDAFDSSSIKIKTYDPLVFTFTKGRKLFRSKKNCEIIRTNFTITINNFIQVNVFKTLTFKFLTI